jgi:hypothetical protein
MRPQGLTTAKTVAKASVAGPSGPSGPSGTSGRREQGRAVVATGARLAAWAGWMLGPECIGGGGGLFLDPCGEVFPAVARVGWDQADLGPFIHPPDHKAGNGSEGWPSAWVEGKVDDIDEAADREAEIDTDAGDAGPDHPGDGAGECLAEVELRPQELPGLRGRRMTAGVRAAGRLMVSDGKDSDRVRATPRAS